MRGNRAGRNLESGLDKAAGAFELGDGPGLGGGAVPGVGRFGIENFGDGSEATFAETVAFKRHKGFAGPFQTLWGTLKGA